jgi:hypothetical protein
MVTSPPAALPAKSALPANLALPALWAKVTPAAQPANLALLA